MVLSDSQFLLMLAASRHQGAVIMVQWKMVVFNRYGDAPIFFYSCLGGGVHITIFSQWLETNQLPFRVLNGRERHDVVIMAGQTKPWSRNHGQGTMITPPRNKGLV